MITHLIKKISINASLLFLHLITRAITLSFACGSSYFFFPLSVSFLPLIGLYSGFVGLVIHSSITYFLQNFITFSSLGLLALRLPTLAGGLYWALNKRSSLSTPPKTLLITLLCSAAAGLFILHPVGYYAAPYTLFWAIPILTTLFGQNSLFFHALGSTFTCHAVGSVVWLYAKNGLTSQAWLHLIPLVCIERLLYALLMTGFCYSFHFLIDYFNRYKNSLKIPTALLNAKE
jgi:hypothetical protein